MFKIVAVILSIIILSGGGAVAFIFLGAKKADGQDELITSQDLKEEALTEAIKP